MKPLESINKEIARLEKLCAPPSVVRQSDRDEVLSDLRRLRLCFELLSSERVNLRDLVSSSVRGRQNAVADAVGIRRGTLSEYLNGKTAMSSDTVEAILNFKTPENGN